MELPKPLLGAGSSAWRRRQRRGHPRHRRGCWGPGDSSQAGPSHLLFHGGRPSGSGCSCGLSSWSHLCLGLGWTLVGPRQWRTGPSGLLWWFYAFCSGSSLPDSCTNKILSLCNTCSLLVNLEVPGASTRCCPLETHQFASPLPPFGDNLRRGHEARVS